MRTHLITTCAAGCVFMCASALLAEVTVAPVFGDHMVLQREWPVPVWGTAAPGEQVSVGFAGQTVETKAGPDGNWLVKLKPLETSRTAQALVA